MSKNTTVYILGAGFSKAISSCMPLTNDLGKLAAQRLSDNPYDAYSAHADNPSFEQWLSLMSTDLPFLDTSINLNRRSWTMKFINEIGSILNEKVDSICQQQCPLWLKQFVHILTAEKAKIITFNYDTLLEIAINTEKPVASLDNKRIIADEIVFPRPLNVSNIHTWGDLATLTPYSKAIQIIKPHGSLNWYRDADVHQNGINIYRLRERREFGNTQQALSFAEEREEMTGMEYFLIPPSSNKAPYYAQSLNHRVWYAAFNALQKATRLIIIGYSFPETDFMVNEMMRQGGDNIRHITIVDIVSSSIRNRIVSLFSSLSNENIQTIDGEKSVEEYVKTRIKQLIHKGNEAI